MVGIKVLGELKRGFCWGLIGDSILMYVFWFIESKFDYMFFEVVYIVFIGIFGEIVFFWKFEIVIF